MTSDTKQKKNKKRKDSTVKNVQKKTPKTPVHKSPEISNIKNKIEGNRKLGNAPKNKTRKIKLNKHPQNKAQKLKKILERRKKKEKLKSTSVNENTPVDRPKKIKYDNNHKINIEHLKKILEPIEKTTSDPVKKESKSKKNQSKSLPLRDRMMTKLRASRFRFLNEALYTSDGTEAKQYFKDNPDEFTAYHDGYKQQVSQWPINPLNIIISAINKLPKSYVVADFGCGEAQLAESVPHEVHSFDLVAINDRVKACDMAHTPLLTESVNVVVFCLSLMGTNLKDYLNEANRVLKKDGILKIAEVESRFDSVEDFIKMLESYGFVNTWKDLSHNLFYFMDFKKSNNVNNKKNKLPEITLKPCLYKKR